MVVDESDPAPSLEAISLPAGQKRAIGFIPRGVYDSGDAGLYMAGGRDIIVNLNGEKPTPPVAAIAVPPAKGLAQGLTARCARPGGRAEHRTRGQLAHRLVEQVAEVGRRVVQPVLVGATDTPSTACAIACGASCPARWPVRAATNSAITSRQAVNRSVECANSAGTRKISSIRRRCSGTVGRVDPVEVDQGLPDRVHQRDLGRARPQPGAHPVQLQLERAPRDVILRREVAEERPPPDPRRRRDLIDRRRLEPARREQGERRLLQLLPAMSPACGQAGAACAVACAATGTTALWTCPFCGDRPSLRAPRRHVPGNGAMTLISAPGAVRLIQTASPGTGCHKSGRCPCAEQPEQAEETAEQRRAAGRGGLDRRHVRCLLPAAAFDLDRPWQRRFAGVDAPRAVRRAAVPLRHPAAVVPEEPDGAGGGPVAGRPPQRPGRVRGGRRGGGGTPAYARALAALR